MRVLDRPEASGCELRLSPGRTGCTGTPGWHCPLLPEARYCRPVQAKKNNQRNGNDNNYKISRNNNSNRNIRISANGEY